MPIGRPYMGALAERPASMMSTGRTRVLIEGHRHPNARIRSRNISRSTKSERVSAQGADTTHAEQNQSGGLTVRLQANNVWRVFAAPRRSGSLQFLLDKRRNVSTRRFR